MNASTGTLILAAGLMFAVLAGIAALSNYHSLNIKARTVGPRPARYCPMGYQG